MRTEDKMIKALFFDLGNVIVKFDVKILEEGYAKFGYKPNGKLAEYIVSSDAARNYMRGRISSRYFYYAVRKELKIKAGYKDFFYIWNSMFSPSPETEKIVTALKEKHPDIPMILVSDTNEEHFGYLRKTYPVLDIMDHFVLSYEVGWVKPHPKMYTTALALAGTAPKETFYADDREDLIKRARSMGIRAFHFTGHEKLVEDLAGLGIEV
jgi:putative hydrolase of the HAD superfamily